MISKRNTEQEDEKVTVNSEYYHEHQATCNILIKFTYLMASKLLQTSAMVLLAEIVSNVNLKTSTILAKD